MSEKEKIILERIKKIEQQWNEWVENEIKKKTAKIEANLSQWYKDLRPDKDQFYGGGE